jgi:hypothetical protein
MVGVWDDVAEDRTVAAAMGLLVIAALVVRELEDCCD